MAGVQSAGRVEDLVHQVGHVACQVPQVTLGLRNEGRAHGRLLCADRTAFVSMIRRRLAPRNAPAPTQRHGVRRALRPGAPRRVVGNRYRPRQEPLTSIRLALASSFLGSRISRTPCFAVAVTWSASTAAGRARLRVNEPYRRSTRW